MASECKNTLVGESYEFVKKRKNVVFLTSLLEIKDSSEISVSNKIIGAVSVK